MSEAAIRDTNAELTMEKQAYTDDPLSDRETDRYRQEYVMSFVEKWDELINWEGRAESEGQFFIDILRSRGKQSVIDVACGTGFHSVNLTQAGFDVTSTDGSAAMIAKAFANGQSRGLILKTVQADWRWLNRDINGKYDAIVCLGNSFTHLHTEADRRRALAEFYAALKHDGVLILDQRNYDTMLDEGFRTKHRYYYCGDKVTAEPEYIDETLSRFKYSFPDGSKYTLNMCPIRKDYVRRLISEAGFQRIKTYGDFQSNYVDSDVDFYCHVAEKSALGATRWGGDKDSSGDDDVRDTTEAYYDGGDADTFYSKIWGGTDLHVGIYENTTNIRDAGNATVDRMAGKLPNLGRGMRVLDIGAGYGGAMRRVVEKYGCKASCLNISETQNDVNRRRNREKGFEERINVVHGVFEDIPEANESFEAVWSIDSILHSDQRETVLAEVFRVLKPDGYFVFTDPMQADDVPEGVLEPVYARLSLTSLGSMRFYREAAEKLGFEMVEQEEMVRHLRAHYNQVRENLLAAYDQTIAAGSSKEYVDTMLVGLENWVKAADAGHLNWGIQLFRKPE
ncbi:glycine/sarcosine N-methyltransferase [Pararhizobium mangrovi]|uniref:Methyltransferase domain-containing protein n=1 Tax=Pararhizobium mangrovi TaxID=2590452 RepID=A0A506U7K4_9HYPH|nr:methyltransferase domain-containing protein [Pararhizobium mangrovi]TPW30333.1 methyltransferase domain-containing protein [Pararhizobium mangrovi]